MSRGSDVVEVFSRAGRVWDSTPSISDSGLISTLRNLHPSKFQFKQCAFNCKVTTSLLFVLFCSYFLFLFFFFILKKNVFVQKKKLIFFFFFFF